MSVLFRWRTKFCEDRKEVYQQPLACSNSRRWLQLADLKQTFGGLHLVYLSSEIGSAQLQKCCMIREE